MKFRKLVMELGIVAAAAVMVSIPSAVSVSAAETVSNASFAAMEAINAVDSDSAENLQETNQEEKSEWEGRLLALVEEDSSLTVRSGANADAEVVGKMKKATSGQRLYPGMWKDM